MSWCLTFLCMASARLKATKFLTSTEKLKKKHNKQIMNNKNQPSNIMKQVTKHLMLILLLVVTKVSHAQEAGKTQESNNAIFTLPTAIEYATKNSPNFLN